MTSFRPSYSTLIAAVIMCFSGSSLLAQEAAPDITILKTQTLHAEHAETCADFEVAADPEAAFAGPGACFEYHVAVSNVGDAEAQSLEITDVLDANMIFQGLEQSGFSGPEFLITAPYVGQDCGDESCIVAIEGATLSAGGNAELTIRTLVK